MISEGVTEFCCGQMCNIEKRDAQLKVAGAKEFVSYLLKQYPLIDLTDVGTALYDYVALKGDLR